MSIFENVKKIACQKGISINCLEERAEIAKGSIYKWKHSSPTTRTLCKVAAVLGCEIDELLK